MNYEALFSAAPARPVSVGIVGVGEFGVSLAVRNRYLQRMQVRALADIHLDAAMARLLRAGIAQSELAVCETVGQAQAAIQAGKLVLTADASLLMALPLDVLVEATGQPEAGASNAERAIQVGMHVVMVTKETDSVVGPLLRRKAQAAGVVYTAVDGDQPSLLIKLVSWARELGLEILGAGKASEYDFVYDPQAETVTSHGRCVATPGMRQLWELAPGQRRADGAARAGLLSSLPLKTAPDFCEMGIVANATGLLPDQPALHAPVARTVELPDLFCADGGLFTNGGTLDIFNCFRRSDEASFAGGVFVVADVRDDATFAVLRGKCIPASREGNRLLIYNPTHLLGIEAPITILCAALLNLSSFTEDYRPRCDMTGRALCDLPAGTSLVMAGDRHAIPNIAPLLTPAAPVAAGQALPYYMMAGSRLVKPVRAGEIITAEAVSEQPDTVLWRLRAEQDKLFHNA